jgi:hypothetical protein
MLLSQSGQSDRVVILGVGTITEDFASMLGVSWYRLISIPKAQAEYNLRGVRPVFGLC